MTVSMLDYANIAANVYFYPGEQGNPPKTGSGGASDWQRQPIDAFFGSKPNYERFSYQESQMPRNSGDIKEFRGHNT